MSEGSSEIRPNIGASASDLDRPEAPFVCRSGAPPLQTLRMSPNFGHIGFKFRRSAKLAELWSH